MHAEDKDSRRQKEAPRAVFGWRKGARETHGVTFWLDPAPNRSPVLAMVTSLALTRLLRFLAKLPVTVTSSPIFIVVRLHPLP